MFTWPTTFLPEVMRGGHNVSTGTSRVLSQQMASGRMRNRVQYTSELTNVGVSWLLTDFQYHLFLAIFRYKLGNGSAFFTVNLRLGDLLQAYTARIVNGIYKETFNNGRWSVTATLEVADAQTMDVDTYNTFLELDQPLDTLEQASDDLHILVNVHLPHRYIF